MHYRKFLGISVLLSSLLLATNALSEPALGICAEATAADVSADAWSLVVNGTYRALEKKRPSTTHSWEALNIVGMDNVNLDIIKTYDDQVQYTYALIPRTHNRNAANIENKVIVVRLGTTPDQGKRNRVYKYYIIGDLVGCNVQLQHDLGVHLQGLRWDYAIAPN